MDILRNVFTSRISSNSRMDFDFLRLRIIAKFAILGKSMEKLLPNYQKIRITEKQIAV